MSKAFAFHPVIFVFCFLVYIVLPSTNHRFISEHQDASVISLDTQEFVQRVLLQSQQEIVFLENIGQIRDTKGDERPDILFLTRSEGVDIYLTNSGMSYIFRKHDGDTCEQLQSARTNHQDLHGRSDFYRLDMEFVGMNQDIVIKKELDVDRQYHYYTTEFPHGLSPKAYRKITIEDLYEGIDLIYYEKEGRMKYDFILKAGADAGKIRMMYKGGESMEVDAMGSVIITTPLGQIREEKPYTYSQHMGLEIESGYRLQGDTVLFDVAGHNTSEDIIIDPVREWATYYGGSGFDLGRSMCTDEFGNLYVTGRTSSTDFPAHTWAGAYNQSDYGGGERDAFILKFDSSGEIIWATYYGGSNHDVGWDLSIDRSGHLYVVGRTASDDFPTQITDGAFYQSTFGGGDFDAFILKLNSNGERVWATYYGGSDHDVGWGLCTDRSGKLYVTGRSGSNDFPVQALAGAYNQSIYGGGVWDAFILKFDSSGARQWATYYGGSGDEEGLAIVADNSANTYVVGGTGSEDFPTQILEGAYNQTTNGGDRDAFILKFDSSGTRQWATYYGGSGDEAGKMFCTDSQANIYVTGATGSGDFPTRTLDGAYNQASYGGGDWDIFILKFDSSGARQWATYYGGSDLDRGNDICKDHAGNLYVVGTTQSKDVLTGASTDDFYQATIGGETDAVIIRFDMSEFPDWTTYYGGSDIERGWGCCIDDAGKLYVTGNTRSIDFPVQELTGAYIDSSFAGEADAYILGFDTGTLTAANQTPGKRSHSVISDLSIFPNPASTLVTVRLRHNRDSEIMLRLTDLKGIPVYTARVPLTTSIQEHRVNVSQLPAGVYFLHLEWEGKVVSEKIIILH